MVFEKVKELIVEKLNVKADKVTMDARLVEDLEADSLDAIIKNSNVKMADK